MSKFMNGLNNDIPSPVEEGVVDSIKNFFGRNKAITVDTSAIKSDINSALQQITSLAKTSEFKKLAKGLYKVSSGSMEVYDEHYKTIGDLNDKRFSEIPIKAGQELHVNIGEIQFWKIFPNKDRLDRSPGAERGDLSPEGKEFDRIVNEFSKALDEKVKSDKYKISIEWLVDWDDNNYDIVFKFVPRNYIKNDSGIKESFSSVSDKEAVQEELFPILTGKELPVKEMSDGKAGALALAATIGIAGLGCGVLAVIGKGIEKLFGSHKSSGSGTVSRDDIEKIKRLSQQFMDTQQINSSERRKVFGEAYGLLKKHFDPMYFKTKAIEQGTEWNDPADFYSGKINIIEFAFTQSEHQSLVGDDKIDSSLPNDEYWKEYDKLAKKWIADVTKAANAINKELSKKYNGKYRIFFEELDGGYWDYFGEGDGDEGAVVIVDVDMIDRMKSYIKNHAVEESFTEITTEAMDIIKDAKASNDITPALRKERLDAIKLAKQLLKKHFPSDYKPILIGVSREYEDFYEDISRMSFLKHKIAGEYLIDVVDDPWEYDVSEKEISAVAKKAENAINKELEKKAPNFRISFELLHGCVLSAEEEISFVSLIDIRYCNLDGSFKAGISEIFAEIKKGWIQEYNRRLANESTEVATEGWSKDDILTALGFLGIGALAYKQHQWRKEDEAERAKEQKEQEEKAKRELEDFNKKENWIKKHPVDSKERLAVYNFAYKLIRSDGKFLIMTDDELGLDEEDRQKNDKDSFLGKGSCLLPDYFMIDIAVLNQECSDADEREIIKKCNDKIHRKFGNQYSLRVLDHVYLVDVNLERSFIKSVHNGPTKESTEVIYEGWGVAFTRFAVKHNLPFANKLEDKIWEWSESTVNQLTNIPEFKEYILREAPKAYDEAYLRNNNLSINVNADMISEFEEEYEDSEAYHKVDKKNCCFCKKIGKFYVGVFGDKSHIHGVWLLMSDSKNKKIYAKALPAPEKELNKFKYQK